jgi:hypothetical protein
MAQKLGHSPGAVGQKSLSAADPRDKSVPPPAPANRENALVLRREITPATAEPANGGQK